MSEVNGRDDRIIERAQDVLPLYQGAGEDVRFGAELELCFYDPASLKPMNSRQNARIFESAGFEVHREPGPDVLEVTSAPYSFPEIHRVVEEIEKKAAALTAKAGEEGLERCFYEFLPHVHPDTLLADILPVPRYQAFFVPVRRDMADMAAYFVTAKSTQVSVSYADPGHMLENVRRLYFLAPFLFLLCDNSPPFVAGDPKPAGFHPGMAMRASLGPRGGVPPHFFTAARGENFIRAHIDHVMHGPMFVYYERDGTLTRLPEGQFTNFVSLKEQGLNTAANYFLAESTLWPDVKIAALRGADGLVNGHRYEARMFSAGSHQTATALAIVAGLASLPGFSHGTERLLKEYGFYCDQPAGSKQLLEASYRAARMHGGRFFDIPYGLGRAKDFAARFADLLEEAFAGSRMANAIEPALHICRTGRTDALVARESFPTLGDARAFLNEPPPGALRFGPCADNLLGGSLVHRPRENGRLTPGRAALE